MKLKEAQKIAEEVKGWLKPYCQRIEIVGSVRRRKAECGDMELLCVPKTEPCGLLGMPTIDMCSVKIQSLMRQHKLDFRLNSKGSRVYGPKNKLLTHVASGFPVDIFSTDEEGWATAMVIRTGSKSNNIRIAMAAKKKGWKFNAYGSGFTKEDDSKVICKIEKEVFEDVGLKYLEPWER